MNLLKRIIILFVISYLFSGCAIQKQVFNQTDVDSAYNNAIKDAEKTEPHEISKELIAIVPSNTKLVWKKKENKDSSLLVVTWTNYNGYDDKVGQSISLLKEIWVTTVPEVKNFCKKLKGDKILRLEQILGLPPNAGETKFVEMWVKPSDLFRPSADPEISDCEAEIDFPLSDRFVKVSEEHIKWFNNKKITSYVPQKGYPWTRLGYTYDWGNDANHIGLSEFVIVKGAEVEIHSVSSTSQYCQ